MSWRSPHSPRGTSSRRKSPAFSRGTSPTSKALRAGSATELRRGRRRAAGPRAVAPQPAKKSGAVAVVPAPCKAIRSSAWLCRAPQHQGGTVRWLLSRVSRQQRQQASTATDARRRPARPRRPVPALRVPLRTLLSARHVSKATAVSQLMRKESPHRGRGSSPKASGMSMCRVPSPPLAVQEQVDEQQEQHRTARHHQRAVWTGRASSSRAANLRARSSLQTPLWGGGIRHSPRASALNMARSH